MTAELEKELFLSFDAKRQKGWLALYARSGLPLRGYGTRRIGTLMPDGELHISIGASELGRAADLNSTIKAIIRAEGLNLLTRTTTSGSRAGEYEYPAFQTDDASVVQVIRILHSIEGAALQGQMKA